MMIRQDFYVQSDQYKLLSKLTILKIHLNLVMQSCINTANLPISLFFILTKKKRGQMKSISRAVFLLFFLSLLTEQLICNANFFRIMANVVSGVKGIRSANSFFYSLSNEIFCVIIV
jgi:hypothetical protein